jgi:hypothetical protein
MPFNEDLSEEEFKRQRKKLYELMLSFNYPEAEFVERAATLMADQLATNIAAKAYDLPSKEVQLGYTIQFMQTIFKTVVQLTIPRIEEMEKLKKETLLNESLRGHKSH